MPPPLDLDGIQAHLDSGSANGPQASWVADQATALLAEVDRLRKLLEKVVVIAGDDSPACPSNQGQCWWCNTDLAEDDHASDCPWPELETAVKGWKKAQPAAHLLTWHPGASTTTKDE